MGIYFTIKLFRIKPPSHVFTEKEIKEVLRSGNDLGIIDWLLMKKDMPS